MTYPWVTGERLYSADLNDAVANAGGLVQIGTEVTFAASSAISVEGCYSADHDWYRIVGFATAGSGSPFVAMRNRLASTDDTSLNYYDSDGTSAGSSAKVVAAHSGGAPFIIDVFNPFAVAATFARGIYNGGGPTGPSPTQLAWAHNVTSSFDGFTLIPATSTLTGSLRVYGYRND